MDAARFWERRPLAFAHRGGSKEAPQNTMAAFERAVALGVDVLELDLHRTRDGHIVVCHDPTVDRTTDGTGRIADLTLDQLRRLDFAATFVPGEGSVPGRGPHAYPLRGQGIGISTFAEVLERFRGVPMNLDIKQTWPNVRPYERDVARTLADHDRVDDVIVTSFNDRSLAAFRRFSKAPIAVGPTGIAAFVAAGTLRLPALRLGAVAIQVSTRWGRVPLATEANVALAHRAGLAFHVWTIDDEAKMGRLLDLGVDGVMTDRPTALLDVLRKRASGPPGAP